MSEVPIRVWRVGRSSESLYVLLLRDDKGALLPMTIGPCEAVAIWSALQTEARETTPRRPETHDLLCTLIERLGGRLVKVVVDDLWNRVYFAKLHLEVDGTPVTVDTRPSDAVAIALRLGAPLFASSAVLEAASEAEDPSEPAPGDLGPDLNLDDL